MNTTAKGTTFEKKVLEQLRQMIENKGFAGVSRHYNLLYHPKYKSNSGREIVPDIAIEVFHDEAKQNLFNRIIFECKCYKQKVEIGDFDEFRTKLQVIGESRAIGFMVTTVGFSAQIINDAKFFNIGLIVLDENSEFKFLANRHINAIELEQQHYKVLRGEAKTESTLVYMGGEFTTLADAFAECGLPVFASLSIPYLSDQELESIAATIVEYDKPLPYIEQAIDYINSMGYFIDIQDCSMEVLGICDVANKRVIVKKLKDGHRTLFTCAHEIGHVVLHSQALSKYIASYSETEDSLSITHPGKSQIRRMEYQANLFASYILMPPPAFRVMVHKAFIEYDVRPYRLRWDNQPCNNQLCHNVLGRIANTFGVSKKAVEVRLKRENLLEDCREERTPDKRERYSSSNLQYLAQLLGIELC